MAVSVFCPRCCCGTAVVCAGGANIGTYLNSFTLGLEPRASMLVFFATKNPGVGLVLPSSRVVFVCIFWRLPTLRLQRSFFAAQVLGFFAFEEEGWRGGGIWGGDIGKERNADLGMGPPGCSCLLLLSRPDRTAFWLTCSYLKDRNTCYTVPAYRNIMSALEILDCSHIGHHDVM